MIKVEPPSQSQVFYQPAVRLHSDRTDHDPSNQDQHSKANLGKTLEELRILLPNMLQKSLPKQLISRDVLLRICPTHFNQLNHYLPRIKGHVSYYTTMKTIQFVLTSLILNPDVKLHLQSIKVMTPEESNIDYLCVFRTTKIQVRWSTCNEGCGHLESGDKGKLEYNSTSNAKLGSHKWTKVDTLKFLQISESEPLKSFSHLTTGLVGLMKELNRLERVISGIFVFELNEDNSKIIVHTIEDVNIVEKREPQVGGLRIC